MFESTNSLLFIKSNKTFKQANQLKTNQTGVDKFYEPIGILKRIT